MKVAYLQSQGMGSLQKRLCRRESMHLMKQRHVTPWRNTWQHSLQGSEISTIERGEKQTRFSEKLELENLSKKKIEPL